MMRYMRDDLSFHDSRTYSGSIKGSEVFLLSLRMTARMECRLKPKLLRDVDHPIFSSLPKGRPRCALDRRSSNSDVLSGSLTNSIQRSLHRPRTQKVQNLRVLSCNPIGTKPTPFFDLLD